MSSGRLRGTAGDTGPQPRRRRHVRRLAPEQEPGADIRWPDDGAGLRGRQPHGLGEAPPSALSVHFIAGGDPEKDLEFHVVRLRDERRFANRRVDVMQDGELLTTAIISYMNGGSGIEHGIEPPELPDPESVPSVDDLLRGYEDVVPHFVSALRPIDWRYTNDPTWVMRDKGERLDLQPGLDEGGGRHARRPGDATPRRWSTRRTPPCSTRSSPRTGCRGASTASLR